MHQLHNRIADYKSTGDWACGVHRDRVLEPRFCLHLPLSPNKKLYCLNNNGKVSLMPFSACWARVLGSSSRLLTFISVLQTVP